MTGRQYRITGRVQGVGFRCFTVRAAEKLGIRGSVRNAEDGSVLVRAAGPAEALEEFAQQLRRGPPNSDVRGVEEAPEAGEPEPPDGFRILR